MRIWHEALIPRLCQKHLCAMWREGIGCYKILTENKKGYRNHPAVKEFEWHQVELHNRLYEVRQEMLKRGYNPKPLPTIGRVLIQSIDPPYKPWQTLSQQIEVLRAKGCKCQV